MGELIYPPAVSNPLVFSQTTFDNLSPEQIAYYEYMTANGLKMLHGFNIDTGINEYFYYATVQSNPAVIAGYLTGDRYGGYWVLGELYWLNVTGHSPARVTARTATGTIDNLINAVYTPTAIWSMDWLLDGNLLFASSEEAYNSLVNRYPITYRPTNCTFPNAPTEAAVGDTVTVSVAFEEGYGIVNPSDIYVTCNGVTVTSTYNNGTLTFTMPDPS